MSYAKDLAELETNLDAEVQQHMREMYNEYEAKQLDIKDCQKNHESKMDAMAEEHNLDLTATFGQNAAELRNHYNSLIQNINVLFLAVRGKFIKNEILMWIVDT